MKLAIVGTGLIAREVVPHLREWGYAPAAVCGTERSVEAGRILCRENGIPQMYTDYGKMLKDADISCVYLAVPNHLHFPFAKAALEAGKHVIAEKPMTSNSREANEIAGLALRSQLFLFEAISTVYLENYRKIREWLPRIGGVRIVTANYSQYSRRYDAFREGTVLPAFDPEKSGGALMDLNLYNLHYIAGLFGKPSCVSYAANIERGIDTSGIVTLDYGTFQEMSVAAKDCAAPSGCVIQGTKGYLSQDTPANRCGKVTLHLNDGTEESFDASPDTRFENEFLFFREAIENRDLDALRGSLARSITVSEIMTEARKSAGIVFPADREPGEQP